MSRQESQRRPASIRLHLTDDDEDDDDDDVTSQEYSLYLNRHTR